MERECPICKKPLVYARRAGYITAEKKGSVCKVCSAKRQYQEDPTKNKGPKNGRYGKTLQEVMENKYGEAADLKMESWRSKKNKFKEGEANPSYGVPGYKNSGMSYHGWYKSEFFRSTLELWFMMLYESQYGFLPAKAEGGVRIPYKDPSGRQRTYTPDFLCLKEGRIIEIKCSTFVGTPENKAKFQSAVGYCQKRGLTFDVITEKEIKGFPGYDELIPELQKWERDGVIKLTDKALEKLKKRIEKGNKA